ncbi:MAG: HD domain-containing protein [Clostridia bacterium]|nr:HD domain-containing protein [Clostridia bacterium]
MEEIKVDKNPYRDKKFRIVVEDFRKQGLTQLKLEDELKKLVASKEGKYFREKYKQLDKSRLAFNGIHGISHSNRVSVLAMLIAEKEGILTNDLNNRIIDFLVTATYYHDIGRKKGPIVINNGPHAKNSARKINKMDLKYLDGQEYSEEDKRTLQAIVEAHEGKDKDMEAICKKYKISSANIEMTKKLMTIVKDADALDRVRLDIDLPFMMKVDLNPDYLRTNTAKQFINASYELEALLKNVSIEELLSNQSKQTKENDKIGVETFAEIFEKVKIDNYKLYNERYQKGEKINTKNAMLEILNNYLQNIIPEKSNLYNTVNKIREFGKRAVEHLTGDYEIGIGDVDFDELIENAETISSMIAYSNNDELNEILEKNDINGFADGVVDGLVASDLILSESRKEEAKENFKSASDKVRTFFINSIDNIANLNTKVANFIAHSTKMDTEESKELNTNLFGKAVGGILYEFISGTLGKKRHFTDVKNSPSILEKIEHEGILHFASPTTIDKIMESKKIKKSNFIGSDLTKKKCFFFAGVPTFEDLLINIPAYDVMTAIRIKPTEDQIEDLKYRAINDRAVVKDGDFRFNKEQVEIVHYGLKFDEEKRQIYLGELTEEEAKDFEVSKEVRDAYHYEGKKSTLAEKAKMNIYGLYAEYKHHQKLLQMEGKLRENGIRDFRNVNDRTLVELGDIEQAYIDTKDRSVERKNLMTLIKSRLTKNRENDKLIDRNNTIEEI